MKKEKEKLNPQAIQKKGDTEILKKFSSFLGDTDLIDVTKEDNKGETSDNFFRVVIGEMLNSRNISLKTEWVNLNEQFSASKLEFLSKYADMPYAHDFVEQIKIDRVSYLRKSRIELIKAFEKREEDIGAQNRLQDIKNLFNMN